MKARTLIDRYERYCPQELSEEGDVRGLQIGSLDKDIKTVMVTLDVREGTVAEAIQSGVDLIITKHAPIYRGIQDLVASPQRDILLDLVKHDIAVYVSHTNIDIVPDGLNDWFCDLLGITDTRFLAETQPGYGLGRIGKIAEQSLNEFALTVKETFDLDAVRVIRYNQENPLISTVAICGGSGEKFYKEALKQGADVYITGDVNFHTAQEMLTEGLFGIDPGHYIESLFISRLVDKFQEWKQAEQWDIKVIASQSSTNPFSHL